MIVSPEVRYDPVQRVGATDQPIPTRSQPQVPAAFGVTVGEATEKLGGATSATGDELFKRGLEFQDMHNETIARNQINALGQEIGQREADFMSKEGLNAGPDAYAAYAKGINDLRTQYRNQLGSPMAQKMFDSEAQSYVTRSVMTAARWSGEQLKQSSDVSLKSQYQMAVNDVNAHPTDANYLNAAAATAKTTAEAEARVHGYGQDWLDAQAKIRRSDIVHARIDGLNRSGNGPLAMKLFDEANKDGVFADADKAARLKSQIEDTINRKTTADVSFGLRNGDITRLGEGKVSDAQAMAAVKHNESSGAYGITGITVKATKDHPEGHAVGAYGVMSYNLQPWLAEARKAGVDLPASMTEDQFLKDSASQDKLFLFKFNQYQNAPGGSFNKALDQWLGYGTDPLGTNNAEYRRRAYAALYGVSSTTQRVAAGQAEMANLVPNYPLAQESIRRRITDDDELDRRDRNLEEGQRWDAIQDALKSPDVRDADSLMNFSGAARVAYNSMSAADQHRVQTMIHDNIKNDDKWTPIRQANFERLSGMSYADTPQFLKQELESDNWDLRQSDRKALYARQQQGKRDGRLDDPDLPVALKNPTVQTWLTQVLGDGYQKNNPDEYHKFLGALQGAVYDLRASGRTVSYGDMQEISHDMLLNKFQYKGFWGQRAEEPLYQATPQNDAERNMIISTFKRMRNREPSQEEIQIAYAVAQFERMKRQEGAQAANK